MPRGASKRSGRELGRERRSEAIASDLRAVAGALVRRLRAQSAGQGLSVTQGTVLVLLHRAGQSTVAELARLEHVTPQSMGATVASLEAEGLVARTADPEDARRWNASLTEKGRRLVLEGRAARQAWLSAAIQRRLDDDEQRRLAEAIVLLSKLLAEGD